MGELMAQEAVTVLLVGNVVRSEQKAGEFNDREDATRLVKYDFILARVLTPEFDIVLVRFPSDGSIPLPSPDELVTLRCGVRASFGTLRVDVEAVLVGAPAVLTEGKSHTLRSAPELSGDRDV